MSKHLTQRKAISLVEVLMAMAMLSMLALPMGMFMVEYVRGSSQLGDYYQILNLLEQRLEIAMNIPFQLLPEGEFAGKLVENPRGPALDLRPIKVDKSLVKFNLTVEVVAVNFSALKDSFTGQLQRARVEEGMKRLDITAEWGDKRKHLINLIAYRSNL